MRYDSTFPERLQSSGKKIELLRRRKDPEGGVRHPSFALLELDTAMEELRAQQDEIEAGGEWRELDQFLVGHASDAFFLTDDRTVIVAANPAAAMLTHVPPQFLIGKPLLHFLSASALQAVRRFLHDLGPTGGSVECTSRFCPRGGPDLPVSLRAIAFRAPSSASATSSAGATSLAIRWLIRDARPLAQPPASPSEKTSHSHKDSAPVTPTAPPAAANAPAATASDDQRDRQNAQHASRMKDQFLAMVVHELRNPLTPVLAVLEELLEKKDPHPEPTREILDMMHRNLLNQSRMIGDLLDIARITHGKLELRRTVIDLADPVRQACDNLRGDAQDKRQQLQVECPAQTVAVFGDDGRLRQVFSNLLSNAIRYTPSGGTITLRLFADTDHAHVEVSDNGAGIRPEALARIFEPFEQDIAPHSAARSGLGLGLSIVRLFVGAHGGEVQAFSDGEGKGARFRVHLPRANEMPLIPDTAKAAEEKITPPLKILVVEDHTDTRRALASLLSRMGHDVRTAAGVEDALAETLAHRFDLTLIDLSLSDGDGRDFLRRASRSQIGMAVACSGWGRQEDLQLSHDAGFALHLTKPVSLDQLRKLLATVPQSPAA